MSAMMGEGIEDLWNTMKKYKSTGSRIEQDRIWIMHHAEQLLTNKFRQFCDKRTEVDEETLDEFIKDWNKK